MNFLKNKLLTPFRRADMANSPFHRGINMEEKRSTLFADRRRIPGRKAKVLLTVMFCFQMVGMKKLVETKKFMKRRDLDQRKLQRKCVPFLQAMTDVRYLSLKERNEMIIEEVFAYKGEEFLKKIRNRFNQTDIWCPYTPKYNYMYNKTQRYVKPYYTAYFNRFLSCYETPSI